MNYWLLKSEPNTYSWDDFFSLGKDHWDGVRNYQARNFIREMKPDDLALFYHSVKDKEIVGIARVISEPYQDPTDDSGKWSVVDLEPSEKLKSPVTLEMIKQDDRLSGMVLLKNSRLSVQPVKSEEFDIIIGMSEKD